MAGLIASDITMFTTSNTKPAKRTILIIIPSAAEPYLLLSVGSSHQYTSAANTYLHSRFPKDIGSKLTKRSLGNL